MLIIGPQFFFQHCQPAQNQPKTHKNSSLRDIYIMTLALIHKYYEPKSSWCCIRIIINQNLTWSFHNILLKGQLISKCLFVVFNFFQKTTENKSTWGTTVLKLNLFILEETSAWKNQFDFVWPLVAIGFTIKYKRKLLVLKN